MHAWEAIQKTLNHIEEHLGEDIQIEELAEIAVLSLFYYQRLFTRLVKTSVRDYIKLRRLAKSLTMLRDKENRIIDIAMEYGFGSHVTFTRAFEETYGITPSQYRDKPIGLQNFDKPDLLLGYIVIDEGVPLISDGLVLEMNRKFLEEPINFLGVTGYYPFKYGKMVGERTGVDTVGEIWDRFYRILPNISHISEGRWVGVSYHGDAPDGYSSYFVGAEVKKGGENPGFADWQLPIREYVVCGFESENHEQMIIDLGKAMKYTRFWLKKHNLIADGFFPEMYYKSTSDISYVELWIPFKKREK
ncbi:AraC family transcriptional regulator [Anaerocolumna jejuensis DSM 15929]|uniref:AraC family transcriptional regulator n=1 Tax=Anaerocolumna jejuensis DSM 15929 TaxID=1121322 RepID=A0A1M6XXP1_9FIRM|nr:helix-turn-helix domain-containing protein [Anaerocolumna jejuensis]SHL10608.1 AraC family transcriptional regulator [Anaerocolumna jejuensis DSM 15929]